MYFPSLTISDRHRLTYRFDLDFNLPGDWYLRFGLFDNYDSKPPPGFSKNGASGPICWRAFRNVG